ncbi:hypothetical protein PP707_08540, partial [Acetobacter pasteurianus]|nr:hypothetical protein [Acetobacter pasteurianus]
MYSDERRGLGSSVYVTNGKLVKRQSQEKKSREKVKRKSQNKIKQSTKSACSRIVYFGRRVST